MKLYDLVKVKVAENRRSHFKNAEGMIMEIDESHDYPYVVFFFAKHLQVESIEGGIMCWNKGQLEVI